MKIFNNIVTIFVVIIILMIIIPLNAGLLDLMFILNISLSFVILFASMYIKEALEFSIFPSLLLVTTLFRLALNVSATRLILDQAGNAGKVIRTFGEFVIGGNAVVGFVVFLIIVVVQFVVITKGSERVAEVSARFTLDAMPGKQMAIDADLSSGLIEEDEARLRRSKIQREADMFGSMDGATKFVKGDAIVAIIITIINLVGGIVIGLINNYGSFSDILQIYTTATVGNGLVSQLPALMISVATGMIVTRSASESDFNTDIIKQFTAQPTVIIFSGFAVAGIGLIPGFPKIQVLIIAGVLIGFGFTLRNNLVSVMPVVEAEEEPVVTSEVSFYKDINNIYGLLSVEQIEIEFGYSLLPLVGEGSGGSFIDRVILFRKQYAIDMGMVVPSVKLKDSSQLNPNQYSFKLKGEEIARGEVLVDHYLALAPADVTEEIEGIDTIEPAFGIPAKWLSENKRIKAELAGYTLIDPTSVIITHLSEIIKQHAHELLSRQEINNLIDNLKKTNEALVNETIPAIISVSDLQKVLANLLREGVPIRDLETIIETMADYMPTVKDTDLLSEYVRQALKRSISRRYSEAGQMKVITLDAHIENQIMNSVKKMDTGSYLALEPQTIQRIVTATTDEINKIKDLVQYSIVLTSPIVRVYFKKLIDQFYPNITVLSFSEIETDVQIQALGNISA